MAIGGPVDPYFLQFAPTQKGQSAITVKSIRSLHLRQSALALRRFALRPEDDLLLLSVEMRWEVQVPSSQVLSLRYSVRGAEVL